MPFRIPVVAFTPGCTLVIHEVEKGHREIPRRRRNSRMLHTVENPNGLAQIARIILQTRNIYYRVASHLYPGN